MKTSTLLIVIFFFLASCYSCKKEKPKHKSKHEVASTVEQDTIGAEMVENITTEENIPENTYMPDTSDVFRNGILRQLHIPVEEQIYYQVAEIPYLENRTAVIIIKSDDKTRNTSDYTVEKYLITVETSSCKILTNRIIETPSDPSVVLFESFDQFLFHNNQAEFKINFDFSNFEIYKHHKGAFGLRYTRPFSDGYTNFYNEDFELYIIKNDSAFSILEPTTIASSIATGIPCKNSSFQELKGQVLIGKKEVNGYKDIIFKFTINKKFTHAKEKSDSVSVNDDDSNCEETNEKETRIQIFRYNPNTKKYKVLKKHENILENWSHGI